MMRASSYEKITPFTSLGVKNIGSFHWTNILAIVNTCLPYFLFPLSESPPSPTKVAPKITVISSKAVAYWLWFFFYSAQDENPSLETSEGSP